MPLQVRTEYLPTSNNDHEYFIEHFQSIIPYFHLANNANIYNIIITDETKDDIKRLHDHLTITKKNPEFNSSRLWIHGSSEEHAQWASDFLFQYKVINEESRQTRNSITYSPQECKAPAWKYTNNVAVMEYFTNDEIQILRMEGFEHNWDILSHIHPMTYIFVQLPCLFTKWNFEYARDTIFSTNPMLHIDNIIWECPDLDTMLLANEYKFTYIFANHNCWLDYNIFKLKNIDKKYTMVMNCRPEREFKRPYLARAVPNIAYIKGKLYKINDSYDYSELQYSFINEIRISPEKVNDIYSESYCGGIFSSKEGACYSSSEYLLCGLPVVSTVGRGGRDTWFNEDNSIIVEADEFAVKTAVETWIERYNSGKVNPSAIREKHIQLQNQMRNNFNDKVQEIFNIYDIKLSAHEYFTTKYKHHFKTSHKIIDAIKFLKK